jgi:hypothetical protein
MHLLVFTYVLTKCTVQETKVEAKFIICYSSLLLVFFPISVTVSLFKMAVLHTPRCITDFIVGPTVILQIKL